jgi:hypothetical protein
MWYTAICDALLHSCRGGGSTTTILASPNDTIKLTAASSSYQNNMDCRACIRLRDDADDGLGNPGRRLRLAFTQFNTEANYDYLTIDGDRFSGSLSPFTWLQSWEGT